MHAAPAAHSRRLAQKRYAKGGKLTLWAHARVPEPRHDLGTLGDPIEPSASSGIAGPLGVAHLPRMWMEGTLAAAGRLPKGYDRRRPDWDVLLRSMLGIDARALDEHFATLPHYMQTEAWTAANARRLDAETVGALNATIRGATRNGANEVMLADLADWDAIHASVLARIGAPMDPIFPAISSRTLPPSGIHHLPRLWLKNVLLKAGALPIGYRSGRYRVVKRGLAIVPGGVDLQTYGGIGLSVDRSAAYIEADLPDYVTYENWVHAHATKLDPVSLAAHNAIDVQTRPAKAAAERLEVGWESDSTHGYLLDDLLDWRYIHSSMIARRKP